MATLDELKDELDRKESEDLTITKAGVRQRQRVLCSRCEADRDRASGTWATCYDHSEDGIIILHAPWRGCPSCNKETSK